MLEARGQGGRCWRYSSVPAQLSNVSQVGHTMASVFGHVEDLVAAHDGRLVYMIRRIRKTAHLICV